MRVFAQCPAVPRASTSDPGDRRYHSETNSCPACGPRLWFEPAGAPGRFGDTASAGLEAAARCFCAGGILALRGLGGFHLAVDATSEAAVARLRAAQASRGEAARGDGAHPRRRARGSADRGPGGGALLCSAGAAGRAAPAPARTARLAPAVAPGLDTVGVMLAYTPLHHLLLDLAGGPLVMTSGNRSEEPIAIGNDEAPHRLGGIADAFLLHDREIVARYDDSVVRVAGEAPVLLRRARGYAPLPLELPVATPRRCSRSARTSRTRSPWRTADRRFVSQHIGDLETLETLEHFRAALDRLRRLFRHRARGRRPRPASRLPLDPPRGRARAGARHRGAAPPRAHRRGDGGARAHRPGDRRRVRRHRLRRRRPHLGRRDPRVRSGGLPPARRISATHRCRAAMPPRARPGGRRSATCRPSLGGRRASAWRSRA